MRGIFCIGLLIVFNVFMTLAGYSHLKFKDLGWFSKWGLPGVFLLSWGIAFFEYTAQVPANRIGFQGNGGHFNLWQLKVIQEVITLVVFSLFTLFVFKNETLRLNHLIGFALLILAVYFIFKK